MTETQPWEKRDDESGRAYAAFLRYRDMGASRSLDKAYALHWRAEHPNDSKTTPQKASRHWFEWSKKFNWVQRVQDFDRHMQAQLEPVIESNVVDMRLKWIEDELRDAQSQLEQWNIRWGAARLAAGTLAAPNLDELYKLTQWRIKISDFGRRALGMPDTLADVTSGGQPIAAPVIKFTWDDGAKDNGGHGDGDD